MTLCVCMCVLLSYKNERVEKRAANFMCFLRSRFSFCTIITVKNTPPIHTYIFIKVIKPTINNKAYTTRISTESLTGTANEK